MHGRWQARAVKPMVNEADITVTLVVVSSVCPLQKLAQDEKKPCKTNATGKASSVSIDCHSMAQSRRSQQCIVALPLRPDSVWSLDPTPERYDVSICRTRGGPCPCLPPPFDFSFFLSKPQAYRLHFLSSHEETWLIVPVRTTFPTYLQSTSMYYVGMTCRAATSSVALRNWPPRSVRFPSTKMAPPKFRLLCRAAPTRRCGRYRWCSELYAFATRTVGDLGPRGRISRARAPFDQRMRTEMSPD